MADFSSIEPLAAIPAAPHSGPGLATARRGTARHERTAVCCLSGAGRIVKTPQSPGPDSKAFHSPYSKAKMRFQSFLHAEGVGLFSRETSSVTESTLKIDEL